MMVFLISERRTITATPSHKDFVQETLYAWQISKRGPVYLSFISLILTFVCFRNLKDRDAFSKSDPVCVLFTYDKRNNNFHEVMRLVIITITIIHMSASWENQQSA